MFHASLFPRVILTFLPVKVQTGPDTPRLSSRDDEIVNEPMDQFNPLEIFAVRRGDRPMVGVSRNDFPLSDGKEREDPVLDLRWNLVIIGQKDLDHLVEIDTPRVHLRFQMPRGFWKLIERNRVSPPENPLHSLMAATIGVRLTGAVDNAYTMPVDIG